MYFFLSKTMGFFAVPSNLLLCLGFGGIVLSLTRFAAFGRKLMTSCLVLLVLIGILPVGIALTVPLESRFPQWQAGSEPPAGIIVLGGAIDPSISIAHGQVSIRHAAGRIIAAVELARRYPNCRIVFSGGNADFTQGRFREADAAAKFFEAMGLDRDRIILERESRNTSENAIFTKRLIAPKNGERWLLVTSAMHMPRAIGVFRENGFSLEAYPVDYRSKGWADLWQAPTSLLNRIGEADRAIHEWIGLIIYRITGRSAEMFPHR